MNAVNFAEELTQVISRWTKTGTNVEGPLLTNQQAINVIRDVAQIMLGVTLQVPDYSSVRTPATGIAVCTPNAPTIPKINLDSNNTSLGRFRSLDTLTSFSASENVSGNEISKSQEKMEIVKDEGENTPETKKFISRSSPAIHVSSVSRSGTFVREESEKKESNGVADKNESEASEKIKTSALNMEKVKSNSFMKKIYALRESAYNVISEIEQVEKEMFPETTKPIRRLSSIGHFPGLGRSSTLRPNPPPKLRRSSSGFPGTPTSSKLNTTLSVNKEDATRSKSVSTPKISPTNRTISTSGNKKSPMKPMRNPKYAHVQSTIPKALANKRKPQ
ncbi:uncharacterized protein LOC105662469 [Megachile rotundata]|uniref:uncharacterized protein LOC105662469 n=1 Tax=Megachile rotundata TaxID=143995 RepID=UPI003FD407F4